MGFEPTEAEASHDFESCRFNRAHAPLRAGSVVAPLARDHGTQARALVLLPWMAREANCEGAKLPHLREGEHPHNGVAETGRQQLCCA